MTNILEPELRVERVDGHPGQRRIVVAYRLEVPTDDPVIGRQLHEDAVVSSRDEHDAPIRPMPTRFRLHGDSTIRSAGVFSRRLVSDVHRVDLDVEQDWWETDEAGGTRPIAEFVDHLAARITVRDGDRVAATADTPTLTGSWGALGSD